MKIQVYKCRFTDEIFRMEDKDKYIEHLRELREAKRAQRHYDRKKTKFETWLAEEKEKITHVDMVVPWILENQEKLMKGYNQIKTFPGDRRSGHYWHKADHFANLELTAKYDSRVSNSHSCPRNGVINWCGRRADLPKSYPGFWGRIQGKTLREPKHMGYYPSSDLLNIIGIKTGTGGGGNESWGFDAILFLADWPGLVQQVTDIESEMIVKILKGN